MQRLAGFAAFFLISSGTVLIALAVLGLWSAAPSATRPAEGSVPSTSTGFTLTPTAAPAAPAPTAVPAAAAESAPPAQVSRLIVPGSGIDADVASYGIDANGVMESPDSPELVAWYDFSGRPGEIGNAVFAGHLDYANYGPAVFWRLNELKQDDEIEVVLSDGSSITYRVVSATSYAVAEAPVAEIVGPSAVESVTLITCSGSFDWDNRQYDQRLVVRAVRVSPAT